MQGTSFIQDLAIVMIVAGLVTVLFHRLKQPVVLGYIIAGIIIGPHTPPFAFIKNNEIIETLAELGVVFLMFSLGLHFNLRKLKQVGVTALIAATFEILFMTWIGYKVGQLSGWNKMDSIFLGAILAISSTTIIVKALEELKRTKEKFAELIFGILIVEDILAIALIAFLSSIAMTGSLNAVEAFTTLGKLGIFFTTVLVVGLIIVPPLLGYVAKFKSNEMLLITVLGLCFGICLLAIKLEHNLALGAFLMGAIIAEARESITIESIVEPLRDLFSAVFFVAIGLLIQPALLIKYVTPILVITVAVVVGKILTCSLGTFIAGHDAKTSLRVGMGLAQIGEFSFIIASLGANLKVTSEFLYPIAVSVSALSTFLTPYLIRNSDAAVRLFEQFTPRFLMRGMELYSLWVQELRRDREDDFARQLLRKLTLQMILNIVLVTAVFMEAVFIAQKATSGLLPLPHWIGNTDSMVWLSAILIALPILIAIFRKLEVFWMLTAEISIPDTTTSHRATLVRTIIANTIFMMGVMIVGLWVIFISSALLPSWPTLIIFALIIAAVTTYFWSPLVQIYARAQYALQKTFSQPESPHHMPSSKVIPALLSGTQLEIVTLVSSSWACGKPIREIRLRTKTGANAIGIERADTSILNPSADEILKPGDKILLLGSRKQLDAACTYLCDHHLKKQPYRNFAHAS